MPTVETIQYYQGGDVRSLVAVPLSNLIDSHGGLPGLPQLPVRLRETFTDRPWPIHSIHERIVDRQCIPSVPTPERTDQPPLEIVDDLHIAMGGITKGIRGHKLELLNILLLARDWRIRVDEAVALGFARYMPNPIDRGQRLNVARSNLRSILAPHTILETTDGPLPYGGAIRLQPDMPIVDRREFI